MTAMTSPQLGLPLLAAGQAQKEVTHNEALMLIDLALTPLVETVGDNAPPVDPGENRQWIVGMAPTGLWAGQAGALAGWTPEGWRFVQLPVGATVTVRNDGRSWQRNTTAWFAPVSVGAPGGGTVIDVECRAQLTELIAALAARGLIANV